MNSFERLHAMLSGNPCDRIPCTPILMQFAAHFIGKSYGDFTRDHAVLAEANIACLNAFAFDQASAISDPFRETSAFGADIHIDDRLGPQCHKPLLEGGIDLERLSHPDPQSAPRLLDRIRGIQEMRRTLGPDVSILGWIEGPAAEAGDLRGPANFLMDLLDEPEELVQLMEHCVDLGIRFAEAQAKAGADVMGIGDALASQVSPGLYEEWILPRQKRLIQSIREMGVPVRLHICGNITHLLDGIATLPINAIDVDHMVDLETVRQKLGRSVMIGANLDPVEAIQNGTPESIQRAMTSAYQTVGNPFNSGAGCEITPGTPIENLRALCHPVPFDPNL